MSPGNEVTVAQDVHVLGGREEQDALLLTFDGGARGTNRPGRRVAGAGAVLWGPVGPDGRRPQLARTILALPQVPHAQEAEAGGCGEALDLLLGHNASTTRRVLISGDNMAVIRYCAGTGRLRREAMYARLDYRLGALLSRGWNIQWRAVRRRLNQEADRLATAGVQWADTLDQSHTTGERRMTW